MSAANIFFDTNILLYLLSDDRAKADRAEQLSVGGGFVSVQVLNEFASVGIRKLAMQIGEIKEILSTIRKIWTVKPLDVETHELGLELAERYRYSVHDSMILAAAMRAGCTRLFSEDFQHQQAIDRLTIINPFKQ